MADNPTCTSYDDLEDALEMLSEFKNVNRDSEIQLEVPNLLSSDDESDDGYEEEIGKESHDEYNSIAALRKQKLPTSRPQPQTIAEHNKQMEEINSILKTINVVPDDVSIKHICGKGGKGKKSGRKETPKNNTDSIPSGSSSGFVKISNQWSPTQLEDDFLVKKEDFPALGK